jgi:hypothetical protein
MSKFVFIDNDPATVEDELYEALGREQVAVVLYPNDFNGPAAFDTKSLLDECSVVLMDLDLYGLESPAFGLQPRNGIALEETIRGWLSKAGHPLDEARRAYVLFSHELKNLAGSRGLTGREQVLARQTGNEWVTSKNVQERSSKHTNLKFLGELAKAVEGLPAQWPQEGPVLRDAVLKQLGLDEMSDHYWHRLASEDAERAGLPLQTIGEGHGLALIRWLLHVALPYPSCFVTVAEIAIQFRISPEALKYGSAAHNGLIALLDPYKYHGPLSEFLGDRWWRAGVASLRTSLGNEARHSGGNLVQALCEKLGVLTVEVLPSDLVHPVLVVDENFVPTDQVADISKCVRVLADDWPDDLDRPWTLLELVLTTERLIALVHPDDRYRLPEADSNG